MDLWSWTTDTARRRGAARRLRLMRGGSNHGLFTRRRRMSPRVSHHLAQRSSGASSRDREDPLSSRDGGPTTSPGSPPSSRGGNFENRMFLGKLDRSEAPRSRRDRGKWKEKRGKRKEERGKRKEEKGGWPEPGEARDSASENGIGRLRSDAIKWHVGSRVGDHLARASSASGIRGRARA